MPAYRVLVHERDSVGSSITKKSIEIRADDFYIDRRGTLVFTVEKHCKKIAAFGTGYWQRVGQLDKEPEL